MMSGADFDAFDSSNNNTNTMGRIGDDNPLAMFDSNDGGVSDGDIMGGVTPSDGTFDLLGTGSRAGPNVREEEEDNLFAPVHGGMVEYDLGGEKGVVGANGSLVTGGGFNGNLASAGGGDDGGDNLLEINGLNLRGGDVGDDGEEGECYGDDGVDPAEYGTDKNTPNMAANATGAPNNARRGLFGGWKSARGNNPQDDGNDLLGDGSADSTPSWTSASAPPSSAPRRGLFGRGRSTPAVSSNGDDEAYAQGEGGITGDAEEEEIAEIDPELEEEQCMDNLLRPGDHIFVWQTYGINPRAYQRHAVVFSVTRRGEEDPMATPPPPRVRTAKDEEEQATFDIGTLYTSEEDEVVVTVVSFYHLKRHHQAYGAAQAAQAASGNNRGKRAGCKREYLHDFIGPDGITRKKPVHKVRYGRKVKRGLLSQKAGVGTALKKDQVGLILARVQYVLDHPDHLPDHNALSANGECASLWCVTGRWCTLQGASILAITSVGQAGGALLAGGILSNLTVLVPMPGVWGMAGWWWYVPATVAYPFLVPLLVGLGMASLVPLEILRRNRKRWRAITDGINHEFWSGTTEEIRDAYFGAMATAEREAEMRSFFGVREGEKASAADDARYMPVGGAPGGMDSDDDEDAEALAMQQMEKSCQDMAGNMNIDLTGKPPPKEGSPKAGGWGSFMGMSLRNRGSSGSSGLRDENETQRFHTSYKDG